MYGNEYGNDNGNREKKHGGDYDESVGGTTVDKFTKLITWKRSRETGSETGFLRGVGRGGPDRGIKSPPRISVPGHVPTHPSYIIT